MQNSRLRVNTAIWIALICITIIIFALTTVFEVGDGSTPDVVSEQSLPDVSVADESFDAEQLTDVSGSESYITESDGYALYIDGTFVTACRDSETINSALAKILSTRTMLYDLGTVEDSEFACSIEIKQGHYPDDCISDYDTLLDLLGISRDGVVSTHLKDIYGTDLTVNLAVLIHSTATVTEDIHYGTQQVFTDSMLEGTTGVLSAGVNGSQTATYHYTSIDGEIVGADLLSATVITEAIDQVLNVGIQSTAMDTASYNGFFDYPTQYATYITSGFGQREIWGSQSVHNGIDLARYGRTCYGEDVYACGDGVVIYAGEKGDYGNLIAIRHTDRITTYYAHLSVIDVEVGDVVSQGQKIGEIGTTGKSTGSHLHLEIRIDDVPVNPLKFLDY